MPGTKAKPHAEAMDDATAHLVTAYRAAEAGRLSEARRALEAYRGQDQAEAEGAPFARWLGDLIERRSRRMREQP